MYEEISRSEKPEAFVLAKCVGKRGEWLKAVGNERKNV